MANLRGADAEKSARTFLEQQGLNFVEQNVRYPFGEIDLIMQDGSQWVFVEVKYRKNTHFGGAVSAITQSQIKRIRLAASQYLQQNRITRSCRFDVVAIDGTHFQWLKDAF